MTNKVHNWIEHYKEEKKFLPRYFQITIDEFDKNIIIKCEMKNSSTGFHSHKSTCEKGKKGKYMCRLARPSPVVNKNTRPVFVFMSKPINLERKEKAEFEILEVDKALKLLIHEK